MFFLYISSCKILLIGVFIEKKIFNQVFGLIYVG